MVQASTLSDKHVAMSYLIPEHLAHLRAGGASPDTVEDRERLLRRLHAHLPYGLAYACTEHLEAWLGNPAWKRWTRYTYRGHVVEFYRWATVAGHLDGDPTTTIRKIKAPKLIPHPVTDAQLAAALGAPEPLHTAILLAAYAGLRRSEIARCHREHITEQSVLIPLAKGGDPGTVPTHPAVWERMARLPDGPVITDHGRQLTPDQLGIRAVRWLHRHIAPDVSLHSMRHWYGTMIQRQFRDTFVTQRCLRHASVATTQGYAQVADDDRRKAVAALPWMEAPGRL